MSLVGMRRSVSSNSKVGHKEHREREWTRTRFAVARARGKNGAGEISRYGEGGDDSHSALLVRVERATGPTGDARDRFGVRREAKRHAALGGAKRAADSIARGAGESGVAAALCRRSPRSRAHGRVSAGSRASRCRQVAGGNGRVGRPTRKADFLAFKE